MGYIPVVHPKKINENSAFGALFLFVPSMSIMSAVIDVKAQTDDRDLLNRAAETMHTTRTDFLQSRARKGASSVA